MCACLCVVMVVVVVGAGSDCVAPFCMSGPSTWDKFRHGVWKS